MPSPRKLSPHLEQRMCLLCVDNATKYNHCSWCGATFRSNRELVEHWRRDPCGPALINYLVDRKVAQ